MNINKFLLYCIGLLALIGLALSLGLGDMLYDAVQAQRLEAQARRDQAQAELLAQRNERLTLLPLATATLTDTGLSVVYALADRALLALVLVLWVLDRRRYAQATR
jgi:hypothetical protein